FVFSILHPCLDGSPFHWRDDPKYVLDESGSARSIMVRRYATEGYWNSGGTGVRGRVGSYHRTLSTYLYDLLASGFRLVRVEEPVLPKGTPPGGDFRAELFEEIPLALVIGASVSR